MCRVVLPKQAPYVELHADFIDDGELNDVASIDVANASKSLQLEREMASVRAKAAKTEEESMILAARAKRRLERAQTAVAQAAQVQREAARRLEAAQVRELEAVSKVAVADKMREEYLRLGLSNAITASMFTADTSAAIKALTTEYCARGRLPPSVGDGVGNALRTVFRLAQEEVSKLRKAAAISERRYKSMKSTYGELVKKCEYLKSGRAKKEDRVEEVDISLDLSRAPVNVSQPIASPFEIDEILEDRKSSPSLPRQRKGQTNITQWMKKR